MPLPLPRTAVMDVDTVSSTPAEIDKAELELDELDDGYDSGTSDVNTFKIRQPLNPPSAKIFSTKDLHELIHDGVIDLNPPYQRDVVWNTSKQIGLIDSIFRNFYIPPVVFAVRKDEDGEEIRICVDGKQRLTSIQKFFDGQIPHRDTVTKKSYYFIVSGQNKGVRAEVPEFYKEQFSKKQITCVEYLDLSPEKERDIFQRVQLGMTLTAAEKLQAISSPWAEWISDLESRHVSVEGGLSSVLEWDTKRARDFQGVAHLVFCCDGVEAHSVPTAQQVEKWLQKVEPPSQQFKEDIAKVLDQLWKIATDKKLSAAFHNPNKRLAPVEFTFIGVLLYVLKRDRIEDQAFAIQSLRKAIRQEYTDIRNNSSVVKSLWAIVDKLRHNPLSLPNNNGKSAASTTLLATTSTKRKRKGPDDEDYKPMRGPGKAAKTRSSHK